MKINNFVLIIGAMKCGTTSLFNYLSEHPEIAPCRYKEPHFFENPDCFYKGFDYYQSLWDWNPDIHKIALEATPAYTKFTHPKNLNAAENIFQIQTDTNTNFKFIYIMRNPLERIESHCNHLRTQNGNFEQNIPEIDNWIIDASKYAMQISEYYKRFDKNSILLLNFDDLKSNRIKIVQQVCQFLNIDYNYEFKNLNTIHNNSNEKVTINLPGYNLARKTDFIKPLISSLPNGLRQKAHKFLGRKTESQVYLSPEQKEYIFKELQNDLQQLKDNYQVNINSWGIHI
jgi:hypothetical protein